MCVTSSRRQPPCCCATSGGLDDTHVTVDHEGGNTTATDSAMDIRQCQEDVPRVASTSPEHENELNDRMLLRLGANGM